MKTVKIQTIQAMRNEITEYKKSLLKAIESGSVLPTVNIQNILEKYIVKSSKELRPYMSLAQARRMSRNTLTVNMKDVMKD